MERGHEPSTKVVSPSHRVGQVDHHISSVRPTAMGVGCDVGVAVSSDDAGYRSYTAIAERVADLPDDIAPSDIRRAGCQMNAAGPCLLLALDRLGRNAPRSALEAAMLDLTVCPEAGCSSPAEIFGREALQSTDGPTDHVRTRCLNQHHFLLPAERLISLHPVDVRDVTADALPSPHSD